MVLAVVDPGVGTDRRAVAVEVGDGDSVLVGPDNGLLAPAVAMVGGASRAFVLDRAEYHLPGPRSDLRRPRRVRSGGGAPVPRRRAHRARHRDRPGHAAARHPARDPLEGGGLAAEVLWVDRFGNAQLNVDPDELDGWGDRIRLRLADQVRSARRVTAYDDLRTGEVGLVVDSYGLVSIAVLRGSAAAVLGLDAGSAVGLDPSEGAEEPAPSGIEVGVELGRRDGDEVTR